MAYLVSAFSIIKKITTGITQLREIYQWATVRLDLQLPLKLIQGIEKQLKQIQEHVDLADGLEGEIENAINKIKECHQKCKEIADQNWATQLIASESNKIAVENLQKQLDRVYQDLNFVILLAVSKTQSDVSKKLSDVSKKLSDMKQDIGKSIKTSSHQIGSQVGVYPITNSNVSPPAAVEKPKAIIKNGKIEVKWNASPTSSVSHFEIKMNDSINKCSANHCIVGSPVFCRKSPAGTYAIQVRAINEGGVGEWSDEATVEYKKAPNKPKKPTLDPSYNNVQVDVIIPDVHESNGAAINKIIVRYNLKNIPNDCHDQPFTIVNTTSQYYSAIINGLEPCKCYSFQIIFVNDCGHSIPSDPVSAYTMPKPRKPVNLRILQCTYDSLIIAWDPPDHRQAGQRVKYQLRYKKRSENDHILCNIDKIAVHGIKLKDLQPCTEYDLVVVAMNKNGHCSEEAHITAKTHYFKKYTIPLVYVTFFVPTFVSNPFK